MFAIVDIETSGGHALGHGITEIGIVLHNGKAIEGKYTTLINPKVPIQKYVQGLTGITDAMVAKAPAFEEVAPNIYNLLKDRIFVAHNVNFDYSFVKHQFQNAGYDFNTRKLCTIRLARKIFLTCRNTDCKRFAESWILLIIVRTELSAMQWLQLSYFHYCLNMIRVVN